MNAQAREDALARLRQAITALRSGLSSADVEDGWSEGNRIYWLSWMQEIMASVQRGVTPDVVLLVALDHAGVGTRHGPHGLLMKHVMHVDDALRRL